MEPKQLETLFNLYIGGKSTEEEVKMLFDDIKKPENEQLVLALIDRSIIKHQKGNALPQERERLILDQIFERGKQSEPRITKSYIWLKIAAAILICTLFSLYLLNTHRSFSNTPLTIHKKHLNDVMPGGNKAVLTLADGSEIILDQAANGTIGNQGNAKIVKLNNGQIAYSKNGVDQNTVLFNTMSTPRGGQYQLILPDGTAVWLNAASSIKYPTAFNGKTREVSTTGEVYFEVAKNKQKPFYVRSGSQVIEVLGTHFNVNAYTNEDDIKTTLLEGSVKLVQASALNKTSIIIKPNEQAVFKGNQFSKSMVNTEDAVAWKNGITSFENADIKMIMRQIERWYDVGVTYTGNRISERLFSGEIPRTATLAQVFKVLELSDIHFKIEGKNVIVSP